MAGANSLSYFLRAFRILVSPALSPSSLVGAPKAYSVNLCSSLPVEATLLRFSGGLHSLGHFSPELSDSLCFVTDVTLADVSPFYFPACPSQVQASFFLFLLLLV